MKKFINIALHAVFGLALLVAGASAQASELTTKQEVDAAVANSVEQTRQALLTLKLPPMADNFTHDSVVMKKGIQMLPKVNVTE